MPAATRREFLTGVSVATCTTPTDPAGVLDGVLRAGRRGGVLDALHAGGDAPGERVVSPPTPAVIVASG
jgi:hypothetical protein